MIIAADNLTAARPAVARAIAQRDEAWLAELCRRVEAAGAHWLDLNPGYVKPRDLGEVWGFLVRTAEAACGLTLVLDSPTAAGL